MLQYEIVDTSYDTVKQTMLFFKYTNIKYIIL